MQKWLPITAKNHIKERKLRSVWQLPAENTEYHIPESIKTLKSNSSKGEEHVK